MGTKIIKIEDVDRLTSPSPTGKELLELLEQPEIKKTIQYFKRKKDNKDSLLLRYESLEMAYSDIGGVLIRRMLEHNTFLKDEIEFMELELDNEINIGDVS